MATSWQSMIACLTIDIVKCDWWLAYFHALHRG